MVQKYDPFMPSNQKENEVLKNKELKELVTVKFRNKVVDYSLFSTPESYKTKEEFQRIIALVMLPTSERTIFHFNSRFI